MLKMKRIEKNETSPLVAALFLAVAYAMAMGFMLFRNNANPALLTASFIDSGSLLLNYIQLLGLGKFNQSLMYHTSIYGWPGNHLTLWLLSLSGVESFQEQAVVSRSVSFAFSLAGLVGMGVLLRSRGSRFWGATLALIFMMTWAPFVVFSYEIHPEACGLFFGVTCLIASSAYSKNPKLAYLYTAWSAAIFAFLSKQPFLVFLLIPVFLGVHECLKSQWSVGVCLRVAAVFLLVGIFSAALSNPYIFLDFNGFIEKQRAIHTHHLQISNTVLYSAGKWLEIATLIDPWYAVSVVFSFFIIAISADRFLKACAWANLLFLLVLILAMKFFFIRSYLYPVLPISIVLISEFPRLFHSKARALVTVFVILGSVVMLSYNAIRTAGTVVVAGRFSDSVPAKVMREFSKKGDEQTVVVYSASLPLDTEKFKLAYNNFVISAASLEKQIAEIDPDLILVDRFWPYSEGGLFSRAASNQSMAHYVVTRNGRKLNCEYQQSDPFLDCLKILIGTDGFDGIVKYDVYVKPSRLDLVKGIEGLH